MKKLNSKGFTLIEMLVVIAIIAILVAIIIPVVANSTARASAATDAANIRSLKTQIVTAYLSGDYAASGNSKSINISSDGKVTLITSKISYPAMKGFKLGSVDIPASAGGTKADNWSITFDNNTLDFTLKYANKTIADFAAVAETAAWPTT